MKFIQTDIEGVVIVETVRFDDRRGWFSEVFSQREFEAAVGDVHFVQDNEVWSRGGAVRGLHFQRGDNAQAKLVRAVQGRILDVAVDLRCGSPTFGRHVAVELTDENRRQLFIPRGFAHGYSVLSDEATVIYKCDNFYAPQSEGGVCPCDPALGIDWEVPAERRMIADRDMAFPSLSDTEQL